MLKSSDALTFPVLPISDIKFYSIIVDYLYEALIDLLSLIFVFGVMVEADFIPLNPKFGDIPLLFLGSIY